MSRGHRRVMNPPTPLMPSQSRRPATDPEAIAAWLARAHTDPDQVRTEWLDRRMALIPLGRAYSAIRIPAELVQVVAGTADRRDVDAFMAEALRGPVIADRGGRRYYALVSPKIPPNYAPHVGERWAALGVAILGAGTDMGVPSPSIVFDPDIPLRSYWVVPPSSAGQLCDPMHVSQLIGAARQARAE